MAKYASNTPATPTTALRTVDVAVLTHEGAPAFEKDAKTALFTLAVTSMTAENTFYESAKERDGRLQTLVRQLTVEDPGFIKKLVPWLRNEANMRSAPIVIAAEYALAGGPDKRQVIRSAMRRADEPAEFVGYWITRTGSHTLPGGVQRGVADAVSALYNEYSAMKYNSSNSAVQMGDVIELSHPTPVAEWQGDLFKYLLDKRHHNDAQPTENLSMMLTRRALNEAPEEARREMIKTDDWADRAKIAGITWEFFSGWLPGGMDKAAWEAVIPEMGYMALLRNLRNFDEAKVGVAVKNRIKKKLADPAEVAKSRQLPFRFWSAYQATQSVTWPEALESALELSVQNIPEFDGTTLVLIDVSASMTSAAYSSKGTVRPCDVAALFGAAVFAKNPKSTQVAVFGSGSKNVTPKQTGSILRNMEIFRVNPGVGHGTEIAQAVASQYTGQDRIVLFTDMQSRDGGASKSKAKFVHYFDVGGYDAVPDRIVGNVFLYAGFTDSTFRQMALNELTRRSDWETILG